MRRGLQQARVFVAALCCGMFAGCSDSPFEVAPTSGTVTIDGQAFTQGKVMFAPLGRGASAEVGRPAFGRLAPDGSFTLTTYEEGDGAVVGEHWVTVIRIAPKGDDGGNLPAAMPAGVPPFTRVAVPTKVTVAADQENRIDVRLTRQEVAQYGEFDD